VINNKKLLILITYIIISIDITHTNSVNFSNGNRQESICIFIFFNFSQEVFNHFLFKSQRIICQNPKQGQPVLHLSPFNKGETNCCSLP
jgi:hypothetical protein